MFLVIQIFVINSIWRSNRSAKSLKVRLRLLLFEKCDSVDIEGEVRSGTESGFFENAVCNHFGFGNVIACVVNVCKEGRDVLAVDREVVGVEHVESAVFKSRFHFCEFFFFGWSQTKGDCCCTGWFFVDCKVPVQS